MALSNTIEQVIRDPYAFSKYRCEFRLDDGELYALPSMRLCNVGVWSAGLTPDTGVYYLPMCGVASCIQSVALYLNGTLIDNNDDVAVNAAIRNLSKSNAENNDLQRWLQLTGTGYDIASGHFAGGLTLASDYWEYRHQQGGKNSVFGMWQPANSETGTSGSILLGDLLEGVRTMNQNGAPVIPAKDLRLVITFNLGSTGYVQDPNAAATFPTIEQVGLQPIRPFLVCDRLVGVPPQPTMQLTYFSKVIEKFPLAETTEGTAYSVNRKSMAFNQKMLADLTVVDVASLAEARYPLGQLNTFVASDDQLQIVLNGSNFLPNQGATHPGQKAYYLNDATGGMNVTMAAYYDALLAPDLILDAASDTSDIYGVQAIQAYKINAMVDRMQINYTRNATSVDHDASTLYLIGRIARVLTITGDQVALAS